MTADGLDPALVAQLRALGRPRRYPAGVALFVEGDDGSRVFLIESGRVKIGAVTDEGRDVLLAIRGPGELLGEFSALDGEPRSASAVALDDVEATVIAPEKYRDWLLERPEVLLAHLLNVIERLRDSDTKRVELSAYDIDRRVAVRLHELATDHGEPVSGGGIRVTVPLSQEELGTFTGASREAVAHSLQRLRKRNVVETSRRGYVVLDPSALAELAGA
jgi:CRP-like cAMP-binding protein